MTHQRTRRALTPSAALRLIRFHCGHEAEAAFRTSRGGKRRYHASEVASWLSAA